MWNWRRPDRTLVLKDSTDESGTMWRAVRLHGNGTLTILGQDIGPGVEEFFGCREYEFACSLSKPATTALRAALDVAKRDDLLTTIEERFDTTEALRRFIDDNGIPSTFWNRTGN